MAPKSCTCTWICLVSLSLVYLVNSANIIKDTHMPPLCSLGVKRFSSKISRSHFYECGNDRGAVATLHKCPQETVYNSKKQKCMTQTQAAKQEMPLDEKALGRTVHLGSFFNAKRNKFDNFNSLWKQETIQMYAEKFDMREVHTEFTADKTLKEKISHMKISADLAADFMSGLVHGHGAADYLNDQVDRDNEVNVEMMFHTTKYVRTLSQFTPKDYEDKFCGEEAQDHGYTHVVTSVTYGMDANFVFQYILSDHESESQIAGELDFAVHTIPSFGISGKAEVNLTESQQDIMEKTTISLFGDFNMNDHPAPTTFDAAIDFYKILPTFAGEDPEWKGAKILNVHMTPIMWVCTDADIVLNSINDALMDRLMDMLDELDQLRIKVGGLIHSDPAQKYKQTIQANLNTYDTALEQFKSGVTTQLQEILPKIRGGDGHGEEDLNDLILDYKKSQFEYELSTEFLGYRHREIEAIKVVLENYPPTPNTLVCDYEDFTCGDIFLHHDHVVILQLNVISPKKFTDDFLHGHLHDESELWFNQVTLNGELGGLIRDFANFAAENVSPEDTPEQRKNNYVIKLEKLIPETPWSITAWSKGQPVSAHEFEVPVAPPPPSYYDVTYEGFKFKIDKPSEFVLGCKVYTVDIMANETIMEHDDVDFPEDMNVDDLLEVTVSGLEPAKPYTYMVRYKTEVGVAPYSQQSEQVITAPASPPQHFTVGEVTTTSVRVSWEKSDTIEIPKKDLEYLVTILGEDGYKAENDTGYRDLEYVFDSLTDATFYSFSVKAITRVEIEIGNDTIEEISQSSEVTVTTYSSPLPPTMLPPIPLEIGLHQITARWEPPRKLGTGVTLQKYVLKMKVQGEDEETTFDYIMDTKKEIKNLKEGQIYEFRCQIVTSEGESEFSKPILIQTLSDETAMDKFKKDLADTFIRPIIYEAELGMTRESSVCGYQKSLNTPSGNEGKVVTYSDIYLEKNDFNTDGHLIDDGLFKAPTSGIYQVDWKVGAANLASGKGQHIIQVHKMSEVVKESEAMLEVDNTAASIPMSGSLLVEAAKDDWIMLMHQTKNNPGTADHVSFCVHLIQETA